MKLTPCTTHPFSVRCKDCLAAERHAKRCRKIANTALTARENPGKKARRWINLVARMTRKWVKANGASNPLPIHRKNMKRFYHARVIKAVR